MLVAGFMFCTVQAALPNVEYGFETSLTRGVVGQGNLWQAPEAVRSYWLPKQAS
jgi:hypothetical protein